MKLADLATGSDWIVWIVFAIFAVLSIILLSGHGSWFLKSAGRFFYYTLYESKFCQTVFDLHLVFMNHNFSQYPNNLFIYQYFSRSNILIIMIMTKEPLSSVQCSGWWYCRKSLWNAWLPESCHLVSNPLK